MNELTNRSLHRVQRCVKGVQFEDSFDTTLWNLREKTCCFLMVFSQLTRCILIISTHIIVSTVEVHRKHLKGILPH